MGYSSYTRDRIKEFVTKHRADIISAIANTGLFFSGTVAQLTVESRWGESGLATNANNYGGIKGNASNGVLVDTTEIINGRRVAVKDYFKKYSSFREFMDDYVALLTQPPYSTSGGLQAPTAKQQISLFVDSGYSTMSPKQYLKSGIGSRIEATEDQYPMLGRISTTQPSTVTDPAPNFMDFLARNLNLPSLSPQNTSSNQTSTTP